MRSDVAGFLAHTRRGPLGRLVRVEGWRQFARMFGGLVPGVMSPYSLRGYFENGGQVAHVWRVAGPDAKTAGTKWNIDPVIASGGGFLSTRYSIVASSPGEWGNSITVSIRYRLRGRLSRPELDLVVRARGEVTETFRAVTPDRILDVINPREDDPGSGSALIRIVPDGTPPAAPVAPGPAVKFWSESDLKFSGGVDDLARAPDYGLGGQALLDEPEVAILAAPDLNFELAAADVDDLVTQITSTIDVMHDRLLLLDVPAPVAGDVAEPEAAIQWLSGVRQRNAGPVLRNISVWHPPLGVPDPLGGAALPIKLVPACGHVAGVISRLDRERGAHWTPANAECVNAVDVGEEWEIDEREALYREGINLVRCMPGKGLQLWGAWTAIDPRAVENMSYLYLAHRRLIHRLVRAIRTLIEPLVFDPNTPTFRFSVQRAISSVLLRFWRAGAFRGARPEEAFQVVCDESNNPPEEQDNGRVWCEIRIAPALPMEFITLRIALGESGRLDVFA
ncbi:MAG TPA: phage tail sheath subtilisin-like domain-containing protein [Kofleriaceae bacterium]